MTSKEAETQLIWWRTLEPNVENSYLRHLAACTQVKFDEWLPDFVIQPRDGDLDANLQMDWLVKTAKARVSKNASMATLGKVLDNDQSTLSRWLSSRKKASRE